MGVIEKFMPLVMEREDDGQLAPIIQVILFYWFILKVLIIFTIRKCIFILISVKDTINMNKEM